MLTNAYRCLPLKIWAHPETATKAGGLRPGGRGRRPYLQLISRLLHARRQVLFLAQAPRQSL